MLRAASVLIVDDDIDNMVVFKKALQRGGYGVGAFCNPEEALEHYREDPNRYDLLLTDVRVGKMSGFDLARRLKEINPATKLLFTTGFELSQSQIEAELQPLASASEHTAASNKQPALIIPKPARLEKILACVKEVLSDFKSLRSPEAYEHVVLLYSREGGDTHSAYNEAIAEYINGGLAKGQLCVYTFVEESAEKAMSELRERITDYDRNLGEGNLLLVDFKPFCRSAMSFDLGPFKGLVDRLACENRNRADKHVRIVGRAAGWLYENGFYDSCLSLERWWHSKPFHGSLVCPYKMSVSDHKKFFEQQDSLFVHHDTILRV